MNGASSSKATTKSATGSTTDRRQSSRTPKRATTSPRSSADAVRLWIRLTIPGVGDVGPGKIELLRQIRERESISAAARAMRMSYRRAWLLIEELNAMFPRPVVATWTGGRSRGGATLTPTGEKLVASYETIVGRADAASRDVLDELGIALKPERGKNA